MELPEGYRAEIVEGVIEVSPAAGVFHAQIANRLRNALIRFLGEGEYSAHQDTNLVHERRVFIPDVLVAPEDLTSFADEAALGVVAKAVQVVFEVASPGTRNQDRDCARKRREYARAGIPVYVIVNEYEDQGSVTVLTEPRPGSGEWGGEHRVAFGTEVELPEGPAKGFVIGEAITGPKRD